jgi:HK97 family phage major capsid protein
MILQQYYEQRGELVAEARSILDGIENETDTTRITEAEQRHDAVMEKLKQLDTKIQREERQLAAEKAEEERRRLNRPNGRDGSASGVDTPGEGEQRSDEELQAEYRAAFLSMIQHGESRLTPEQRSLLNAGYRAEERIQLGGTNAAGGFTVPRELQNEIIKRLLDWGPMYDPTVTREIVTSGGNPLDYVTNDDTAQSGAALAEGADPLNDNSGDVVFGQRTLGAFTYATPWVQLSLELIQDSAFNMEAELSDLLGVRLGRLGNRFLTIGTGTGQPQGVVTGSTQGLIAASATAIAADELIQLQHSVNAAYRRSPFCRWMFADTTMSVIRRLKDGQGNYLWQMGDVRVGQPDQILGKPYSINDDVPAIATGNRTVLFGDFSRYVVRKVGGPLVLTARERFLPKLGIMGLMRFDGRLLDDFAVRHLRQL